MVGLVLVSHSRALAEALVKFIEPMSAPGVKIAIAAGAGPDRQELGTDAAEIMEAIQSVYSPDGVLVMMDLGSAILSTETAVDLLPPEHGEKIRLCSGPFVEGSLAAAVQIGLGADLDAVYREAQQALGPKTEQLAETPEAISSPSLSTPVAMGEESQDGPVQQVVLTLMNQHGLHARPAARFVQTAGRFRADVRVTNMTRGKGPVTAASLNDLATLGAVSGHQIRVEAAGPEAPQVLDALSELVRSNFGESGSAEAPAVAREPALQPEAAAPGAFRSLPVSPGIAIGPLFRYQPPLPAIPTGKTRNPEQAWKELLQAIDAVRRALEGRRNQVAYSLGEEQAAIFDAHMLILQDATLLDRVRKRIETDKKKPAAAWYEIIDQTANAYRDQEDPYLRQRETDVRDVGRQVLAEMTGGPAAGKIELSEPVVLFAEDLTPTETTQLDLDLVLGIMTVAGGGTSHSAILARAMGIPAVAGVDLQFRTLKQGTLVAFDGATGDTWIEPGEETLRELRQLEQTWRSRRAELQKKSRASAVTRDGKRVEIFANIGSAQDARVAVQNGAEGVGLLRTEFLFLARQTPPEEDEQYAALAEIGAVMGNLPITVRTLDVGGDKNLPYLHLPKEANPFLGVRAIRVSLGSPDLFLTQLRAILRAGAEHVFRIMFPMVATIDEILQARRMLEEAHRSLQADHIPHAWPVETGIMVEVPSAAILSPLLAREVDFFSIGTNDLTQYTLAAERGNTALASLADAMHPAVLKLISTVAEAAHAEGKWVGVCGELAGEPEAVPVLIGLEVDELSLNPGGIPAIKDIVRRIDAREAKSLAADILTSRDAAQVRERASRFLSSVSE